jgi:hypothetical protein
MNRQVTEMLEAIKDSLNVEQMLSDAAEEFATKYAKTPYIMGGFTVETREGVSVLKGNLKPYNDAGINSYIVVLDGDKVEVRAYGSFASSDPEAQGFGQTSAKKSMSSKGLTASKLAKVIADLGKKAKP